MKGKSIPCSMRLLVYEGIYFLSTKKVIICPPRKVFLVH
jgi:hypothetical protein